MEDEDKAALEASIPYISTNLQSLDRILSILRSNNTITKANEDEIKFQAEKTKYQCNKALINCLQEKRSALQPLLKALRQPEIGQWHIADEIEKIQKNQANYAPGSAMDNSTPPKKKRRNSEETKGKSEETAMARQSNRAGEGIFANSFEPIQSILKKSYKTRLKRVHPFSLPFTFDIDNTWVSLALERYEENEENYRRYKSIRMKDHCQLIEEAFQKDISLLLIEGRAASGKTSLMRRIAYDWASGKLTQYDLVFLTEFRNSPKPTYSTISDLCLDGMQQHLTKKDHDQVKQTVQKKKEKRILVLLDGYDESATDCRELTNYLEISSNIVKPLPFDVIIASRPGPLSCYEKNHRSRLNFAKVLGFDEEQQQLAYINAHFHGDTEAENKIESVTKRLNENLHLRKLAETPLFLTFICLVHEKLESGSVFELYKNVIWWLLDRYQCDHPNIDVPNFCGFDSRKPAENQQKTRRTESNQEKTRTIQDHFLEFPLLQNMGKMALEIYPTVYFADANLMKYQITPTAHESGLLLKDEVRKKDLSIVTQFLFPHRTIQEFLAGGVIYFWPDICADRKKLYDLIVDGQDRNINKMSETEKFIWNSVSKMSETEKFIWNSVSNVSMNANILELFSMYTRLELDLWSIDYEAENFAMLLNTSLRSCSNLIHLSITCDAPRNSRNKALKEPVDLTEMRCLNVLRLQNIIFEINPSASSPIIKLNVTNDLQQVEFDSLNFTSSSVFCATVEMLAKTASSNPMLILEYVSIELNKLEGVDKIVVSTKDRNSVFGSDGSVVSRNDQTKHTVSEYFANEERTMDEPEFVRTLKRMLCVHDITVLSTQKSSWRFLKLPKLPFLDKIELNDFYFEVEEEMSSALRSQFYGNVNVIKLSNCEFRTPLCFYLFMKHLFDQTKRETWIDLSIQVSIEKIEAIECISFGEIRCRLCEFSQKFMDDENFEHTGIEELLSIIPSSERLFVVGRRKCELLQSPISIRLPPNKHLQDLCFYDLNISKNALTFYLPVDLLPKLNELEFRNCVFDETSLELILRRTRLKKLSFEKQRFGTLHDFDAFCGLLQNFGCACEELNIEVLEIASMKSQKQSSTAHDSTSVLCSLARNMESLKIFKLNIHEKIIDDYLIIDESEVGAAGAARTNNADFKFDKVRNWKEASETKVT